MAFFDGFALERVGGLRVRVGGAGRAVVLLHGHPRTHTTWHRVAPRLARPASRSSAPTCPATASRGPTDGSPSARWRRRSRDADARARASSGTPPSGTTAAATSRTGWRSTHGVTAARRAGRRADRRGARALRRALRRELVALVLLRPDGEARGGLDHLARPAGLVPRGPGRRWAPRTTPTGCARSPTRRCRARWSPTTARALRGRPLRRGRRPRGRALRDLPDAVRVVGARRHGGALRRPAGDLARLGRRAAARRADRLRPPHGRGGAGAARGRAGGVPVRVP